MVQRSFPLVRATGARCTSQPDRAPRSPSGRVGMPVRPQAAYYRSAAGQRGWRYLLNVGSSSTVYQVPAGGHFFLYSPLFSSREICPIGSWLRAATYGVYRRGCGCLASTPAAQSSSLASRGAGWQLGGFAACYSIRASQLPQLRRSAPFGSALYAPLRALRSLPRSLAPLG